MPRDRVIGPPTEHQVGHGCFAHGCPLPGVFSPSLTGGGPWFCRAHDGAKADRWPLITAGALERQKLFGLAGKMIASEPDSSVPRDTRKALEDRGIDLAAEITCRTAGSLLLMRLVKDCRL